MPTDFKAFYSLVNVAQNYQLHTNLTQAQLNQFDSQRVQTGIAYAASFVDEVQDLSGSVDSIYRISGSSSDPSPISTTTVGYLSPEPLIYVIKITTGGAVGGALQFTWFAAQYPTATYTIPVLDSNPIDLNNGTQIYFPAGTYTLNDTFVFNATPASSPTSYPRIELWPAATTGSYPYIYIRQIPELSDENPVLPRMVRDRGDVILEMALERAAQWPGTSTTANPYFNLALARQHNQEAQRRINQLEMRDDELVAEDLQYTNMPFYSVPWMDGQWVQRHAIYPY
jgi:hypothetical protein